MAPNERPLMSACSICGEEGDHRLFTAREMMLGLRDRFEYRECVRCGCCELLDRPSDWNRYYPDDYYAFVDSPDGLLKRLLKRWRARHALGGNSLVGALLVRFWGRPPYAEWIERAGVERDDAILDVGSGAGSHIREMSQAGFRNLTGIDPFLEGDRELGPGARLLKREAADMEGPYDFIMMNHSLEHMEEPGAALSEAARLLPAGGILLVRVPLAGKHAWHRYGSDWVQIDAPRHLFLFSEAGMRQLARRAGFEVREVRYDSYAFQFWGSEQYRRNVPLHDERSHAVNPAGSMFTKEQIAEYEERSRSLNARGEGDQASFYLVRR